MDYNKIDMGAYNLHIIKTKKFKTITVDICFRRKVTKDDVSKRIMLKDVLLNSNFNFKTERELIIESEDLYDLKIFSSASRIGNYSNLSFKLRFLNEKFTEKGMNEESIRFFLDILFKPNAQGSEFKKEVVDLVKSKLLKRIKSQRDDKIKYAMFNLLSNFDDMPYSFNPYGDEDIINSITPKELFNYYLDVIKNDVVDVFVVGDVCEKTIRNLFKDLFHSSVFHQKKTDIISKELIVKRKVNNINDVDNVNQAQIVMLYSLHNLTDYERKYVMVLFNELLGGSSSSVLFDNIREKNSYAYYINSIAKSYDNILLVYSGTSSESTDDVIKLIRKNVISTLKGKFNDSYLDNAKETIISSIISSDDTPFGIINTYFAKDLVGSLDSKLRIEKIKNVTKEEIMALYSKIKLNSIYTLRGDIDGNKD